MPTTNSSGIKTINMTSFKLLIISFLLISFFLFACSSENANQRIVGQWQGITWNVNGQASDRNASNVHFEFKTDDSYIAAFGAQKEGGSFRLTDNKLYTTAKGQIEKMVQISLVSLDTMVMDMNRAGTVEQLVLVKK